MGVLEFAIAPKVTPAPELAEAVAAAGVTAIVQPGGSIRDEDSIVAADELGVSMLFTGIRHFKH